MTKTKSGSCLCGAVTFTATPHTMGMRACHCNTCRRWSAGPFMTLGCDDVAFDDESQLGVFKTSEWGERGFCKTCGTSLFWRMQDKSGYGVSISAFEETDDIPFGLEFFIDEKPANYEFAGSAKKLTGKEVFAMFTQDDN
ncbi:MAG: aldehyde-activating protein [Robiginitomaculum sp.]|nr:MAG: aldehyde-activating protein [Robiginitomaculum sp.]